MGTPTGFNAVVFTLRASVLAEAEIRRDFAGRCALDRTVMRPLLRRNRCDAEIDMPCEE